MGGPVHAGVRISVVSQDGAADPASTVALQRRLGEKAPGGEHWGAARSVPHPGGPDTQGAVSDLVLEFVTGQVMPELIKEAVKSAATYLVWTAVSHLRSQPEPTQKVVLEQSEPGRETRIEISATGLSDTELDRARTALQRILESAVERRRREAEPGDED